MLQNLPSLVRLSYCSSAASPAPATCPPALTWCCRTGRRWTRRTRWGSPLSSQTFLKSHLWSFIPQIHYNTIFARSLCADVLFNRKNVILWWVEIVWLQFPIYVSWFTEKKCFPVIHHLAWSAYICQVWVTILKDFSTILGNRDISKTRWVIRCQKFDIMNNKSILKSDTARIYV